MIAEHVVDLSRFQFAATGLYHFIFVPLTLGLTFILAVMETLYVKTNNPLYKDMTKFWGKLFGINFAIGVTTGITMEFQFGTNWSYYSHYVGDIFGAPLAIEGLMAFFLESTFVGMFFFGWDRLTKRQHLMSTWLMALGTNFSALWILVANGWMQFPVGSHFNPETMRMEMTSFMELVMSPMAQVKFLHTVSAGYLTAATFVAGISAFYLLKGRDIAFAKRSFAVASGFGIVSVFIVALLGDESGIEVGKTQPMKLAAMEAEWETQPAPAALTLFGIPDQEQQTTAAKIQIPALLGIISTRSLDTQVPGIKEILPKNEQRVRNGMIAYALMEQIQAGDSSEATRNAFSAAQADLGFGLMLKRYTEKVVDATEAQIKQAALDTIPPVATTFVAFRAMIGIGLLLMALFAVATFDSFKGKIGARPWLLRALLWSIPLPILACQLGWVVAEIGRQPWTINEVLPTFLSASNLTEGQLWFSIISVCLFYTVLLVIELFLMFKFARLGPSSLKSGRYHFEKTQA